MPTPTAGSTSPGARESSTISRFRADGREGSTQLAGYLVRDIPASPDTMVALAPDFETLRRAEMFRVLRDGLRVALPMLLVISAIFLAMDLVLPSASGVAAVVVHVLLIAGACAGWFVLPRVTRLETLRSVAVGFLVLMVLGSGAQGILHGNFAMNAVLLSVLAVTSAAVFPWGVRTQLPLAAATAVALIANFHFVRDGLSTGEILPHLLALTVALCSSLALARVTQRRFLRTVGFRLEGETARAALQQLNCNLERRVRDRTADLEIAYRELEAFSYSVSHDLRAPLRSIDGFAFSALEDLGEKIGPHATDSLNRIRRAAGRMSRLIDGLLRLGRAGRERLRFEVVDLSREATGVSSALAAADPARRVDVRVAPGAVGMADRRLMRVVLVNLLGNAWKYTAGVEHAEIEFGYEARESQVVFHVRDNGVGFEMARVNDLFVPFSRLHSEPDFDGDGVGLATVERIVRRHGGRVWAQGAPGKGATIFFTLDDDGEQKRPSPRPRAA